MVIFKHSRIFNVPLQFAYDWCTDFSSEDSKITGSKFPRILLEKTKKRVVYAGFKTGSDGKPKLAVRVVTLQPKTYSWHLDYFAEEDLEVGDYNLVRLGPEKTKFTVTLNNKWKHGKGPSKGEFETSIKKTWDSFTPALERDYRRKSVHRR
ncbi:MAG: hypothetical protein JRN20_04880 [Nitrososphaerota archaeon]|nr:hypothetical protein [Nitrososphaerota archaeon]MDG6922612.1 hypothetical protein [Nitrososphaerota archaeon]